MFKVTKEQKDSVIRLVGSLEEKVDLEKVIGSLPKKVEINCKGISRINSVGVKAWLKYFQECQKKGVKLKFVECSTSIVESMNLIVNFACGGDVESVYLPFICENCDLELLSLQKVEKLKKNPKEALTMNCTKCKKPAMFDDVEEEYLSFIK